ncbi:unnamed protein product [Symbiodinium microadriaticum]|nr:unnamed protein product [Symbiodinium sp. KB8]CAE7736211.1 unnamed protein product [Symbiodinium microadriaticum]
MQVQRRNSVVGHQAIATGRCRNCSFVSPAQIAPLTRAESLLQGVAQKAKRVAGQVSVGKRIVFTASMIIAIVAVAAWITLLHHISAKANSGSRSSGLTSPDATVYSVETSAARIAARFVPPEDLLKARGHVFEWPQTKDMSHVHGARCLLQHMSFWCRSHLMV